MRDSRPYQFYSTMGVLKFTPGLRLTIPRAEAQIPLFLFGIEDGLSC